MFILVLNAGSSSLRFTLFNKHLSEVYKGHIDGIGQKTCSYRHQSSTGEIQEKIHVRNHKKAIVLALKKLKEEGAILALSDIKKVAHRVVHGGETFHKPVHITPPVLKKLEALAPLAPLHNPVNLLTLKACQKALPSAKHFAIFDTAFHNTLPQRAFLYGLPYELYKKEQLRRYGFHGTSHEYVAKKASEILKKKRLKLITCHIGNGVSLCAIKDGKSLDTTMGYTPLEGPMMGTRSGTVDPGLVLELVKKKGLKKTETLLQKESGFKGLSGIGSDIRHLWAKPKDPGTLRTFDVFSYQMAKLIFSLFAPLGGPPDALVFTAGIGENAFYLRRQILSYFKGFKIKVLVIPTDEALEMAHQISGRKQDLA